MKPYCGRFSILRLLGWVASCGVAFAMPAHASDAARSLMMNKCGSCHFENGQWQRITNLRKSPEGWDMTVVRMGIWHKVEVSAGERKILVKHLADTQGLAPEESAPYRALIERQPNIIDQVPSEDLGQMCGRCHSFGRVALQRRDTDEWRKLVHSHVGQFPSIEYSAMGRDRNWFDLALADVSTKLGELYPLGTAAWKQWQAAKRRAPTGAWRVTGNRPGWGAYAGFMQVKALGNDRYLVDYQLDYEAGNRVTGKGEAILYAGYEWRGSAQLGNQETRSVFALDKDGNTLSGRWFLRNADEIGAQFTAVRVEAAARGTILAVSPALLKVGERTEVRVAGIQLDRKFDFGPDVAVEKVVLDSPHEARVTVKVGAGATAGWRRIGRGPAGKDAQLALYRQIESVRVEPEFGFARLGGGTVAPVTAQFEAIAYLDGPDGKPNTEDDIRLGPVPAKWSVDNHDEKAKAANDVQFAGVMEPHGQFLPAFAGPNPARGNLNNVGDLAVLASVADGSRTLAAKGRLVVTVQRWNTPPLR